MILILIFTLSCNNNTHTISNAKYYYHDKWKIPGDLSSTPLKNRPKEIDEILYIDIEDTAIIPFRDIIKNEIWKFDNNGLIIYNKEFSDDNLWAETEVKYDSNGFISTSRTNKLSKGNEIDRGGGMSVLQKDGRFLEQANYGHVTTTYRSFSQDGNIVKIEYLKSDDNPQKPERTEIYYYNNDKIQKERTFFSANNDTTIDQYYYSKKNYLDSVISKKSGKRTGITVLINSQFGDPLQYIMLTDSRDTVEATSIRYEYDIHNNWIKKITSKRGMINTQSPIDKIHPDFELVKREIKY